MKEINKLIEKKGIKKTWLAKQVGIPQPTLSMYLNEKRKMPFDIEIRINQILK